MDNEAIIEPEFDVHRTLSAMAKQFYVKMPKEMQEHGWKIKEGTTVTGVKAIATGRKIRDVARLVREHLKPNGEPTNPEDWIKARGTATITDGTRTCKAEIHWYQCENVGKVEFKAKRYYDES